MRPRRASRGLLVKSVSAGWLALALFALLAALNPGRGLAYTGQDAIQAELEQQLNSGQTRALAPAQARYREALAAITAGTTTFGNLSGWSTAVSSSG